MDPRSSLLSERSEYYSASDASSEHDDTQDGCEGMEAGVADMSGYDGIQMRNFSSASPRESPTKINIQGPSTDPSPSEPSIFRPTSVGGGSELGLSDNDLHLKPDINSRTVTSIESFEALGKEDEEQSGTVEHGVLQFGEEIGASGKYRSFITVFEETKMDELAHAMAIKWRMRTPKIILSVVSGVQHSTVFHNPKFAEDFQKGLIKAANSSVMWVLTDGIDFGVPKLVGDAVAEEMARRKLLESDTTSSRSYKLPKITTIGVMLRELAHNFNRRGSTESFSKNRGPNPDHTHFILSDGSSNRADWVTFRNQVESRFLLPVGRPRKYRRKSGSDQTEHDMMEENQTTPLVAILLQGGLEEVDHILTLLKKKNPVIVIKGSGYTADLLAFAYEGVKDRPDAEYISTSVKPELMRKVGNMFHSELYENDALRTMYRDKILECVEYAHQGGQTFLTVIDVTQWDTDLRQLSKYILMALFQSEKRAIGKQLQEQILRDLQLTVDWNLSDLAESTIFGKYAWKRLKIENYLFEEALMKPEREEFVELFLRHGFQVHKYLNHRRLQYLFENAEDKDLFFGVCIQRVLGKMQDLSAGLDKNFLEGNNCHLNRLLKKCTDLRNLVNPYELSMNCLGSYVTNVEVAERKAVNTLVLWAALTHKIKLAKLLWKKVDDPIPMALLLSTLFHRLVRYCPDRDLRSQLKQYGVEFGSMAVDILDLSYSDSPAQALGILSKELPDYDNRTALEIANMGQNRYFISHKCCQRWLNQRWCGNVVIRELDWGVFTIPAWLKIYLCAFLIFPMYFWLSFIPRSKCHGDPDIECEAEDDEIEKTDKAYILKHMRSIQDKQKSDTMQQKWIDGFATMKQAVGSVFLRLPVYKQIFYLWSAPVTKFWITQLFYLAYLFVFTLALILPTCGNLYLDVTVFTWTFILLVEIVRFTFVKKQKYPELSILYPVVEIFMIMVFLAFYLFVRIIPHFVVLTGLDYRFTDYQSAKFVMSLGLLYFYYRLLTVFLPISPTLGPMLINILRMVKNDFFTWFRMFLVFMISGAVTIHAVIYPNYPFSWEMFRKAFSRALFALFLTKIDDLEGDPSCSDSYPNATLDFCGTAYMRPHHSPCAYGGNITYVIVIQYLLIVKLVLTTLLFAMFSSTIARISAESNQIWKFQRYSLIVEFEERLRLPPPFIVVSYTLMLLESLWWKCLSLRQKCARCCFRSRTRDRVDSTRGHTRFQGILHIKRTADFNYWKKCVNEFSTKEANLALEKDRPKKDTLLLHSLIEDMSNQKRYNRKLNDRLVLLEKNLTTCLLMMEETKHMIEKLDPKSQGMSSSKKQQVHIYSRQSPYPDSTLERHPVLDKFVPWEVVYSTYDPSVYSKPVEEYSLHMKKFVDADVLRSVSQCSEVGPDPEEEGTKGKPVKLRARWNAVCTVRVENMLIEVDRTSWITQDGRTCRYQLDQLTNLPQNPQGRTGLRGRGSLWRWGPNHSILGVVTRWKIVEDEDKPREYVLIEGRKVLEFITIRDTDLEEFDLPGSMLHGETSPYSSLCEVVLKNIMQEEDVDSHIKLDKEDMIDFFSQFAVDKDVHNSPQGLESNVDYGDSGFTAEILYRGYLDDTRNTDNAWMETEVWNFHYANGEEFSTKFRLGRCRWQELSSQTQLLGNQLDIILEVAKIHNAYH